MRTQMIKEYRKATRHRKCQVHEIPFFRALFLNLAYLTHGRQTRARDFTCQVFDPENKKCKLRASWCTMTSCFSAMMKKKKQCVIPVIYSNFIKYKMF